MDAQKNDVAAERLGIRLDALDQALAVFEPKRLDSLIALRRQIEFALHDAQAAGHADIVRAAEPAYAAGVLDAKKLTRELIGVMRDTALKLRATNGSVQDLVDPATGLMKREAFARIFTELTHKHPHVAVAAVQLIGAADLRALYGPEVATRLNAHVAAALARTVRGQDCVASFEPDHFTIFLPGEDARGLASALKRIEAALAKHPFSLPDGTSAPPSVSVTGRMLDRALQTADTARGDESAVGILSRSAATSRVLETRLRAEGFRPVVAGTDEARPFGETALDAILLDVRGAELEEAAVAARRSLASRRAPILALVADDDESHRALAAGVTDCLRRPLDLDRAIASLRRHLKREAASGGGPRSSRLLIASSELYPLISIGTALHRHTGCEVHLARGAAEAMEKFTRNEPGTVLLDFRLHLPATAEVLQLLAKASHKVELILIIEEYERTRATMIHEPRIAGVIVKPLHLLTLADEVRKATGLTGLPDQAATAALLKREIASAMQPPAA